jgi:hypothetical protein
LMRVTSATMVHRRIMETRRAGGQRSMLKLPEEGEMLQRHESAYLA